ncbi:MAG: class I tRNA ligase family protein, partial [Candidatus Vogelbacteria bacterium]|nr:class I tRNA ligase family protein [Candidatus Vogelbacteria bacterium]
MLSEDSKFMKPYNPTETEKRIYELWEKSGYFNPDNLPTSGTPFTIIMPPPNANGRLHAGHALFVTLEDIMTRYKRLRGYKALWLPGTDHAGFETQVVFEKKLEKEGKSRFDFSQEE